MFVFLNLFTAMSLKGLHRIVAARTGYQTIPINCRFGLSPEVIMEPECQSYYKDSL